MRITVGDPHYALDLVIQLGDAGLAAERLDETTIRVSVDPDQELEVRHRLVVLLANWKAWHGVSADLEP